METEVLPHRRSSSSYFAGGGGCVPSPSCFPVHEEVIGYSRIQYSCDSNGGASKNNNGNNKRSKKWRNIIKRLVRDGKSSIYGPKPLSFHYDAVSYSQNFDEGCHHEESVRQYQVFRDVRSDMRMAQWMEEDDWDDWFPICLVMGVASAAAVSEIFSSSTVIQTRGGAKSKGRWSLYRP